MNRKQRRAQLSANPAKSRRRAVLTGVTAGGLVATGFGTALPAQAAALTASNCVQANTKLAEIVSAGGTLSLNFSGSCVLDQNFSMQHDTTISGPATGGLTLKVNDANSGAFNTGSHLTLSNVNFTVATSSHTISSFIFGATNSTLVINNVEIHDADAASGAIYVEGHIEVTDSKFFNLTSSALSSAIYMYTGSTGSVSSSSFTNNASDGSSWAAVGIGDATLNISNSQFTHNTSSSSGSGGAITNFYGGTVSIDNSQFVGNIAQGSGGAFFSGGGATITINHSEFDSNLAHDGSGGAIYSEGSVTVKNSTFFNNKAPQSNGGAIYVPNDFADVDNSTFVGNQASSGAAMFSEGGIVSNSTFWNNAVSGIGTSAGSVSIPGGSFFGNILANSGPTPVMESGDTDLGANLYTDDSFAKTTSGVGASKRVTLAALKLKTLALNKISPRNSGSTKTVSLGIGSAALDYYTGTSAGITPSYNGSSRLATKDARGVARPINGKYDVGAFEIGLAVVAPAHETILFSGDSAQLSSHAKAQLRVLVAHIIAQDMHSIVLEGHTATLTQANPAGKTFRDKLASARTLEVSKYLASEFKKRKYKVKISRVTKGATEPVKSNQTETGRKANRRVDITAK